MRLCDMCAEPHLSAYYRFFFLVMHAVEDGLNKQFVETLLECLCVFFICPLLSSLYEFLTLSNRPFVVCFLLLSADLTHMLLFPRTPPCPGPPFTRTHAHPRTKHSTRAYTHSMRTHARTKENTSIAFCSYM